jgi:hypothetical protein
MKTWGARHDVPALPGSHPKELQEVQAGRGSTPEVEDVGPATPPAGTTLQLKTLKRIKTAMMWRKTRCWSKKGRILVRSATHTVKTFQYQHAAITV